jgi:hypothetical protein
MARYGGRGRAPGGRDIGLGLPGCASGSSATTAATLSRAGSRSSGPASSLNRPPGPRRRVSPRSLPAPISRRGSGRAPGSSPAMRRRTRAAPSSASRDPPVRPRTPPEGRSPRQASRTPTRRPLSPPARRSSRPGSTPVRRRHPGRLSSPPAPPSTASTPRTPEAPPVSSRERRLSPPDARALSAPRSSMPARRSRRLAARAPRPPCRQPAACSSRRPARRTPAGPPSSLLERLSLRPGRRTPVSRRPASQRSRRAHR